MVYYIVILLYSQLVLVIYNHWYYAKNSIYTDIDECAEETDDCSQTCTNTIGSFICGCNIGYALDIDGSTCNGMEKLYIAFAIHMWPALWKPVLWIKI